MYLICWWCLEITSHFTAQAEELFYFQWYTTERQVQKDIKREVN